VLEHIKRGLKAVTFAEVKDKEHKSDDCGICLLDFEETNDQDENMCVKETPQCGHLFHN